MKAATSTALNAVRHGMEKVSDFLNTALGVGLVVGMALFAETGGGEETPAVAEADEEVEAAVSKGADRIVESCQEAS